MIRTKAYKAFSLIEVLVVMSLTAIVMSIGYFAYLSFTNYFRIYQQGVEKTNNLITTVATIQEQISTCNAIFRKENQILIQSPESGLVEMTFDGEGMKVQWSDIILSCDSLHLKGTGPTIENVLLDTFTLTQDGFDWVFIKQYSTEQRLLYTSKALERLKSESL